MLPWIGFLLGWFDSIFLSPFFVWQFSIYAPLPCFYFWEKQTKYLPLPGRLCGFCFLIGRPPRKDRTGGRGRGWDKRGATLFREGPNFPHQSLAEISRFGWLFFLLVDEFWFWESSLVWGTALFGMEAYLFCEIIFSVGSLFSFRENSWFWVFSWIFLWGLLKAILFFLFLIILFFFGLIYKSGILYISLVFFLFLLTS